MKKAINISLCERLFYLEEDAYNLLSEYLESIRKYFSHIEGKEEIVKDIESRIAEIFSQKLAVVSRVLTLEDVKEVINTIGTIEQFSEVEDESYQYNKSESSTSTAWADGKFYRDGKRQKLGGVAAGLASKLDIDPVWVRLVFLGGIVVWGFGPLIYVLCWIFLPVSYNLPSLDPSKKLYRIRDEKILGGVAAGLAYVFRIDLSIIRILFLVSLFFGAIGVPLYIVLWILTPQVGSYRDRVRASYEV